MLDYWYKTQTTFFLYFYDFLIFFGSIFQGTPPHPRPLSTRPFLSP